MSDPQDDYVDNLYDDPPADEITRLRSRCAEMEGENERLVWAHDDACKSITRHRERAAQLEAEVTKLRAALDKALALFDRYRRIGFSPCKNEKCYRATLTMMQESDAFLCEHEALTVSVPSGEKMT